MLLLETYLFSHPQSFFLHPRLPSLNPPQAEPKEKKKKDYFNKIRRKCSLLILLKSLSSFPLRPSVQNFLE